uniref:inositol-1,3,4-trisphosphate 5/6-kinase n=1 Tax=Aegilops tauschii TaxID=37682 RepID=M8BUB2_AEGTA
MAPYRQSTFGFRGSLKLQHKHYGAFLITQRVGKVAYKLQLPDHIKIHPMFHATQLRKYLGPQAIPSPSMPTVNEDGTLKAAPSLILQVAEGGEKWSREKEGDSQGRGGRRVRVTRLPPLIRIARRRKKGISFIPIDETRPLSEQGPFDIILHKKTSKEWQRFLEDYHEVHPEVTVLDPPNAIEHLNNRQSMLEEVADLNLSSFYVAKPLVVDGTSKSHELSLAYDEASLPMLDPPLVLQEFVNHGGILFKVYIIGEAIQVVRRFSLPDVNTYDLLNNVGIYRLPRVSCAAASADHADLDPRIAELPPRPLLEKLGRELRGRLGLRLFNIDMIRELGANDRYYIIDINYFPGQFNIVQVGVSSPLPKDMGKCLAMSTYSPISCKVLGKTNTKGFEHELLLVLQQFLAAADLLVQQTLVYVAETVHRLKGKVAATRQD